MSDAEIRVSKAIMLRKQLRRRGIQDRRVLAAMAKVPRERFVSPDLYGEAYADRALPIDCDQTISQPYIVALMTQSLELTGTERVLEIGTGSGYQTALLAELAKEVLTIERFEKLSQQAAALLHDLGYQNITLRVGDGSLGWAEGSPYDRILVAAMAAECPASLFEQLAEGGLIVIPLGNRECQTLQAIRKTAGTAQPAVLSGCRFVPLIGAQGWPA